MTSSHPMTIFITGIMLVSMIFTISTTWASDTATGGRETSTSRTVLGELFTATWCGPCVDADGGMDIVLDDAFYFPDRFVVVEWHSSDNYSIEEESARASM